MHCDEIQDRLSAAIDGELSEADRFTVEQHLADCPACREVWTELQTLDRQLRQATAPLRDGAQRVASAALERLPEARNVVSREVAGSSARRSILLTFAGMACGFLLAVVVFRPWREESAATKPVTQTVAVKDLSPPMPAPAVIRAATGPVEYSTTLPASWTSLPSPDGFVCPSGVAVRTNDRTVCELQTASGATIRMNAATELAIAAADDLRLSQGEIWCSTSDAAGLKVTSAVNEPTVEPPVSLKCGTDGPAICVFTCPSEAARMRVSVAAGRIELVSRNRSARFSAGCSVEIEDGAMQQVATHGDAASERWMHPLIVRKGPGNEELAARMNALLAEVGRTKLSYLREADLRSFGEYGALPLLRFLQTSSKDDDSQRRRAAARILADLAPVWMTPELIELLGDADSSVRISAAKGLERLTGQTQGMTPESWGEPDRDLTASIAQWRAWWESERQVYPAPPAGVRL